MREIFSAEGKRLLKLIVGVAAGCGIVFEVLYWSDSQRRDLRAIDRHIARITPQWERFQREHPGFERIKLGSYTGGDGMFAATGALATEEQLTELRKFMKTMPPARLN